ncbi:uncharacterized protein BCR38DRAFT_489270 [Pseudomassariella vexata]|uniref:Uncharacterized protein n=1 Tax=Pseudomassariella vexata TaxID=1141098 RepID=A0A1Y2DI40_9PEZI|nr:uncharacterized protein BCR38DRAFT_489270 [Pseudomassariella vexata]ORY58911.1 hypothetical protein BCR38DRAFT_489270 [Pseudomassariella vexata]
MKYSSLITLLSLSAATVMALPSPVRPVAPRAESDSCAPKSITNSNTCVAAQKLADGIDENIAVQKQEQSDVAAIKKIVGTSNIDQAKFQSVKEKLLRTVNKGISVRESNQKMAPPGNNAITGLRTVANAQKKELSQAESLEGTASDLDIISNLQTEFSGGIEQNKKNKEAALDCCT